VEVVMKFAACAALAVTLFAWQAVAETPAAPVPPSRCGEMPAAPAVPDGATADRKAMTAATEAYKAWGTAATAALDCRKKEIEELRAREAALTGEYNKGVDQLTSG
jgi:hypothetical protein